MNEEDISSLQEFLHKFIRFKNIYIPKDASSNVLRHFGIKTNSAHILFLEDILYIYNEKFTEINICDYKLMRVLWCLRNCGVNLIRNYEFLEEDIINDNTDENKCFIEDKQNSIGNPDDIYKLTKNLDSMSISNKSDIIPFKNNFEGTDDKSINFKEPLDITVKNVQLNFSNQIEILQHNDKDLTVIDKNVQFCGKSQEQTLTYKNDYLICNDKNIKLVDDNELKTLNYKNECIVDNYKNKIKQLRTKSKDKQKKIKKSKEKHKIIIKKRKSKDSKPFFKKNESSPIKKKKNESSPIKKKKNINSPIKKNKNKSASNSELSQKKYNTEKQYEYISQEIFNKRANSFNQLAEQFNKEKTPKLSEESNNSRVSLFNSNYLNGNYLLLKNENTKPVIDFLGSYNLKNLEKQINQLNINMDLNSAIKKYSETVSENLYTCASNSVKLNESVINSEKKLELIPIKKSQDNSEKMSECDTLQDTNLKFLESEIDNIMKHKIDLGEVNRIINGSFNSYKLFIRHKNFNRKKDKPFALLFFADKENKIRRFMDLAGFNIVAVLGPTVFNFLSIENLENLERTCDKSYSKPFFRKNN